MQNFSHLEIQETDSETLGHLDSVSLPSEPPDIRNWFSSYIYESPELDGFQDSDGVKEPCLEEEYNGESGNNHPVGEYKDSCVPTVKSSPRVESESLPFSADSEPPDIRNWFSSYVYESPPLDTASDFAISDYKEREDGKLYDGEKSGSQNKKDLVAPINVEKTEFCTQMNTSDAVVKCLNVVNDAQLEYQPVCKDHDEDNEDDEDDVTLQPLPSLRSLSSSDEFSEAMLSEQRAGYNNHKSRSTDGYGNDFDAKLHSPLSYRCPISSNMENNIGSWDAKPVYRSIGGTAPVKDGLETRTINRTAHKGDSWGSPDDRRGIRKENKERELAEDGFISVRKKSRQANAETNGVKALIVQKKDGNVVRKVLSEISNIHSQNIVGSVGKWSCPQKNKPDLGPPLKQLRLDQWRKQFSTIGSSFTRQTHEPKSERKSSPFSCGMLNLRQDGSIHNKKQSSTKIVHVIATPVQSSKLDVISNSQKLGNRLTEDKRFLLKEKEEAVIDMCLSFSQMKTRVLYESSNLIGFNLPITK